MIYRFSYGWWSALIFLIFGTFAIPFFRRRFYNFFYFTHFFLLVGAFFAWAHAASDFYYMIPGIFMYTIELFMRLWGFKKSHSVTAVTREPNGFITFDVDMRDDGRGEAMKAGSYFFVNFPAISKHQWHPYRYY